MAGKTRALTIKQEKFARQYCGPCEGNASAAYRAAYKADKMTDEAVHVAACRLLQNAKVTLMVDDLKALAAEAQAITIEEITGGLRRVVASAAGAGQHSAAAQALVALAKLGGLMIEKRSLSVDDTRAHLDAVAALANVPLAQEQDDKQHVTH
ncbi:terminase [uncultured Mediterranean phage uvDeep-CGR0-AD1-C123]|nr:terminase [uncultured Mediterranean phage uvDeep-CGR0-AD1-C123]